MFKVCPYELLFSFSMEILTTVIVNEEVVWTTPAHTVDFRYDAKHNFISHSYNNIQARMNRN